MNLTFYQPDIQHRTLELFETDGQWDIFDATVYREEVQHDDGIYPDLSYVIHMRRLPGYYLNNIIYPCVLITYCGMLVFALPPDCGGETVPGSNHPSCALSFSTPYCRYTATYLQSDALYW